MLKSLMSLWLVVLKDFGTRCSIDTTKDEKTFLRRCEHEGEEFLFVVLPTLAKQLEKALSYGQVTPHAFDGWKTRKVNDHWSIGELPVFLGGFFDHVFDGSTGLVHGTLGGDKPTLSAVDSIHAIRQLSLMFAKVEIECTDERKANALSQYVDTDATIADHVSVQRDLPEHVGELSLTFATMWRDVLTKLSQELYDGDLVPSHGPGKTADGLLGNQKYAQWEWPLRLEFMFPFGDMILPNARYALHLFDVKWLAPEHERPVKVVLVPKTVKTPRVIAEEPSCMMYAQKALAGRLMELIEADPLVGSLIGFTNQQPNQLMAMIGSQQGVLATLDLSEASDRVGNWLVEELFSSFGFLSEAIQACRSRRAQLPDGSILDLQKFASMGSALTFPIEAMVFLTIVVDLVWRRSSAYRKDATQAGLAAYLRSRELLGTVRVYGDDIVVPADHATDVSSHLSTFGFKVNENKSFWTGLFRESCGKEYYGGHDVSIVKVRRLLPTDISCVEEIISAVSTRNQFYTSGLWDAAAFLDDVVAPILKGRYPRVTEESPALGRFSYLGYDVEGMKASTQSPFVKAYVPTGRNPMNEIDDWPALVKCLLISGGANPDSEHLQRSGRPEKARIKLRNVSPF